MPRCKWQDPVLCSVEADQKRLMHDEEMLRTLRDLQDVPKELGRIVTTLAKLSDSVDKWPTSRESDFTETAGRPKSSGVGDLGNEDAD